MSCSQLLVHLQGSWHLPNLSQWPCFFNTQSFLQSNHGWPGGQTHLAWLLLSQSAGWTRTNPLWSTCGVESSTCAMGSTHSVLAPHATCNTHQPQGLLCMWHIGSRAWAAHSTSDQSFALSLAPVPHAAHGASTGAWGQPSRLQAISHRSTGQVFDTPDLGLLLGVGRCQFEDLQLRRV